MASLLCPYPVSTSCGISRFLHWSVGIGCKKIKEEKNYVGMNVRILPSVCRAILLKKKTSHYSKSGSIVFLISPEQYLRKL